MISIDGSSYFSSYKISCPSCLTKKSKKKKKEKIRYEHQILQPAVVCPGQKQVIPLVPEQIKNSDGTVKQDCETNAGKRILERIRKDHPKLKIIITGDSLYSNQPFIERLKENRMSYIIIAKPKHHKILFRRIEDAQKNGNISHWEFKDDKDCLHVYEWYNGVELNGTKNADKVNFIEYSEFIKDKRTYHNTWVTNIVITKKNVERLVI